MRRGACGEAGRESIRFLAADTRCPICSVAHEGVKLFCAETSGMYARRCTSRAFGLVLGQIAFRASMTDVTNTEGANENGVFDVMRHGRQQQRAYCLP